MVAYRVLFSNFSRNEHATTVACGFSNIDIKHWIYLFIFIVNLLKRYTYSLGRHNPTCNTTNLNDTWETKVRWKQVEFKNLIHIFHNSKNVSNNSKYLQVTLLLSNKTNKILNTLSKK